MTHYHVYKLGADGRIKSRVDLKCADDEAAIEAAQQLLDEYAVEVWRDDEMLARIATPKQ